MQHGGIVYESKDGLYYVDMTGEPLGKGLKVARNSFLKKPVPSSVIV